MRDQRAESGTVKNKNVHISCPNIILFDSVNTFHLPLVSTLKFNRQLFRGFRTNKLSSRNVIKKTGCRADGVCSTDLRLDTSTNGIKQVYISPEAIY
jgi:hypothetical protein